jgi:SH3-like domain-containing protein
VPAAAGEDRTPATGPYQTGGRRAKFFGVPRTSAIATKDGETVTTEQPNNDRPLSRGSLLGAVTVAFLLAWTNTAGADQKVLDLPKFFSLKSNPVNLRKGPGLQYPKVWIFRREGLPVEVLRGHERWLEVRDSDGATGWILQTLISRRRTALVTPWLLKEKGGADELTPMRRQGTRRARLIAQLETGTLVNLKSCDGQWCRVSVNRFRGYVEQVRLWGVYPNEVVD